MIKLVGLLLPPLIDLINRRVGSSDKKFWITVAVSVVVGVILQVTAGAGDIEQYAESILVVFGLTQLSFNGYWKESKPREILDKRL